jgi:orotate phosphoribosyltransferase
LDIPKSEWSGLPGCLHPQITHAMGKAQDNISSGDTIRIVFGVATVAIAVFIALSQVCKYQKGIA